MRHNDGRHDFDFFLGRWQIANRRLKVRLTGCTEWESFPGVTEARPTLGGLGNIDDGVFERQSGIVRGMTLRLFNPGSREWCLHWADSISGALFTPMVGRFGQGVGASMHRKQTTTPPCLAALSGPISRQIHVTGSRRYLTDGGATWETNWTMDFSRIA